MENFSKISLIFVSIQQLRSFKQYLINFILQFFNNSNQLNYIALNRRNKKYIKKFKIWENI
jgi:hypothetical protein